MVTDIEQMAGLAADRARDLFLSGKYLCSEAVLVVLNEAFGGGLTEGQAVGLAAGFPIGLGEAGCLCGAVSGGVAALGLFLVHDPPHSKDRARVRKAARKLHDRFRFDHKSTCCRVLR